MKLYGGHIHPSNHKQRRGLVGASTQRSHSIRTECLTLEEACDVIVASKRRASRGVQKLRARVEQEFGPKPKAKVMLPSFKFLEKAD